MKRIKTFLSFALFFLLISNLVAQNESSLFSCIENMEYITVSKSVVMLQNEKQFGSNITCVELDNGLVFFDCCLFKERAAKFRSDMESKYKKNTLALVLSHSHIDHFFGMSAFEDVPVIASYSSEANYVRQLKIDYPQYVEGYKNVFPKFDEALKDAKLFMPSVWYDKEMTLGSGESKLIILNTGGHSICSSYALFEKESVIVAGDNLQAEYHPYFGDRTGDLLVWISTLKSWEEMNVSNFCPGHGPNVDLNYLTSTRVFFEDLYNLLVEFKKQNIAIEEIVISDKMPEGYWPKELPKPGWYNPSIAFVYKTIDLNKEE
jgi:glyoxylase-like metal-dependent hydrolase (beta-lactamase superfamily II)